MGQLENSRKQNVWFWNPRVLKTSGLITIWFQKRQDLKTSGFKKLKSTSGFMNLHFWKLLVLKTVCKKSI